MSYGFIFFSSVIISQFFMFPLQLTCNNTVCFHPDASSCNTSLSRLFVFSHLCHISNILPPWKHQHHFMSLWSSYTRFQFLHLVPVPTQLSVTTRMLLAGYYCLQPPQSSKSSDKSWTCQIFPSVKMWLLSVSPPLCHQFSKSLKTLVHSYTCIRSEGDQSEGLKELEEIWQKYRQFTSLKIRLYNVPPKVHNACNVFSLTQLFSVSCTWTAMQGWTAHMSPTQVFLH